MVCLSLLRFFLKLFLFIYFLQFDGFCPLVRHGINPPCSQMAESIMSVAAARPHNWGCADVHFSLSSSASTTQLLFWNGTYLHLQQVLQLKKIINSTQKVTRMMQKEKPKVHPLLLFVALFRKSALKQRIISAVFPRRVRVRLLHHNPRPKKMQMC